MKKRWLCLALVAVLLLTLLPCASIGAFADTGSFTVMIDGAEFDRADALTPIQAVQLSIAPPKAGTSADALDAKASVTLPDGALYSLINAEWMEKVVEDLFQPYNGDFIAGETYYLGIELSADPGCAFCQGGPNGYTTITVTGGTPLRDQLAVTNFTDSEGVIHSTGTAMIEFTLSGNDTPEAITEVPLTFNPPEIGTEISITEHGNPDIGWLYYFQEPKPEILLPEGETRYGFHAEGSLWRDSEGEEFTSSFTITEGETYLISVQLLPYEGFFFTEDVSVSVENGEIKRSKLYSDQVLGIQISWTAGAVVSKDPCEGFDDVERDSWYHAAADFVIASGYMGSTSTEALHFEPMTNVSRAMVASILYRICGSPAEVEYMATFTDVPDGQWYTKAVEWCAQNGLASGKGEGIFDPNGLVTRQELAVFMYKLAAYQKVDVSATNDLSAFPDANTVPEWALAYVKWAVGAGLLSGKGVDGQTLLAPIATAMRCEFASILMRFLT